MNIKDLRKKAKILSEKNAIQLTKAQDLVAKEGGFKSWQDLIYQDSVGIYSVLIYHPGGSFDQVEVDAGPLGFKKMQEFVGGYIELLPRCYRKNLPDHINVWFDEQAVGKGLKKNTSDPVLRGPIVFTKRLKSDDGYESWGIPSWNDLIACSKWMAESSPKSPKKSATEQRKCYWIDAHQHKDWNKDQDYFMPSMISENGVGHIPISLEEADKLDMSLDWGKDYEKAWSMCCLMNSHRFGFDVDDVKEILESVLDY